MKNWLTLTDVRQSDSPQLWVVGCSFSHGLGVNFTERYGSLISTKMNLPVTFLTKPGSSISWAADQILRSDIRKDDIVVWGLTGVARLPYLDESNLLHQVNIHNFDNLDEVKSCFKKNLFVSNHLMYNLITSVEQVNNFLQKVSAKFVLAVMPCNTSAYDLKVYDYVSTLDYAIILYDRHDYTFVDLGSDKLHPGPKQHLLYAQKILEKLE